MDFETEEYFNELFKKIELEAQKCKKSFKSRLFWKLSSNCSYEYRYRSEIIRTYTIIKKYIETLTCNRYFDDFLMPLDSGIYRLCDFLKIGYDKTITIGKYGHTFTKFHSLRLTEIIEDIETVIKEHGLEPGPYM